MTFENEQQAIAYIEANKQPNNEIKIGREMQKELTALVEGDGFKDLLINRIEKIEGQDKSIARKKYSRSIVDLFERLLLPISNVYNSTGGSKFYEITSETLKAKFFDLITNVRGGKTIQGYVEETATQLYHIDPNGLIFMEYDSDKWIKPVYKPTTSILSYEYTGQQVDVVLFEPEKTENGLLYRLVDGKKDYTFLLSGERYILIEDKTFEHPFNGVPAIIISNIEKVNANIRLSPISKVTELAKEYARDQSIKTIYKFLNGFPIHWRYVTQCRDCHGAKKTGEGTCKTCDGHGYYKSKDVTDMVTLPVPEGDQPKLAPDIAGHINPSIEVWDKYDNEIDMLEKVANKTIWGSFMVEGQNETATGRWIDVQPVINKLNKYSDWAEFVEFKMSQWYYQWLNPNSTDIIAAISYGRRFIVDSQDVILDKYKEAKEKGANASVLDKLLTEYITSKYKNDGRGLREELLKLRLEPHVHLSIIETNDVFGRNEANKKSLFSKWWKSLDMDDKIKDADQLSKDFDKWFEENNQIEELKQVEPINITQDE
jgi:hypothetical protein